MCPRPGETLEIAVGVRGAALELCQQVRPLVSDLATGDRYPLAAGNRVLPGDPPRVEVEATTLTFGLHDPEVGGDPGHGVVAVPESGQLRVMTVPVCLPAQDRLRQEPFAPEGDETPCVQVAGVEGPQTHGGYAGIPGRPSIQLFSHLSSTAMA